MSGNGPRPPGAPVGTWDDFWSAALYGVAAVVVAQLIQFVFGLIRSYYQTAEEEFNSAIESTDLENLSDYLKHKLGSLSIHDYVGKSIPRDRVDKYIAKLTAFVGSDLAESEQPTQTPSPTTAEALDEQIIGEPEPGDPDKVVEAMKLLEDGAVWTALATLRRDLELQLRKRLGPSFAEGHPISRPVRFNGAMAVLGIRAAESYRVFRQVANRAVHGEDVSAADVAQALDAARVVYRALENPSE